MTNQHDYHNRNGVDKLYRGIARSVCIAGLLVGGGIMLNGFGGVVGAGGRAGMPPSIERYDRLYQDLEDVRIFSSKELTTRDDDCLIIRSPHGDYVSCSDDTAQLEANKKWEDNKKVTLDKILENSPSACSNLKPEVEAQAKEYLALRYDPNFIRERSLYGKQNADTPNLFYIGLILTMVSNVGILYVNADK